MSRPRTAGRPVRRERSRTLPLQGAEPTPADLDLDDYRLIAENASDVVFRADNDGAITWISPSLRRLLGWTPAEVIDGDFLDFVHDADRARIVETRKRLLHGEPVVMDFRARHRSGDYVWISSAVRPLFDEQGSIVGRVGSWRDATERQLAQQRLTEAKEQFQHLAENASDIVYLLDDDHRVTWITPAVSRALGWSADELLGSRVDELLHPDDRDRVFQRRADRLARPTEPTEALTMEARLRTKDGGYRWFSGRAKLIGVGHNGSPRLIVGLSDVHDLVTERVRASRNERRLASVLETLLDPHLTLDAIRDETGDITDFVCVEANTAASRYLGIAAHQLSGMTLGEVLCGQAGADLFDNCVDVIRTGEPLVLDDHPSVDRKRQSDRRFLDIRVSRVDDSLNFTFRDVTERHRAQLLLAESQSKYQRLAENAADIVYEVSLEGRLLWVSPSVSQSLGWEPDQLLGQHVTRFVHSEDLATRGRSGSVEVNREARLRTANGHWRWMRISGRVLRDAAGQATGFIETAHDIQAEMDARARLAHQAGHDPLTGLPNRHTLLEHLQSAIDTSSLRTAYLITVGVDDLGALIDAFTHTASDRVISHIAEQLTSLAGITLTARLSDDEFAVVAPASELDAIADLADAIQTAVRAPVQIGGHDIDVTVSLGIAGRSAATTAETWLQESSTALHHAKSLGGNRWEFHDEHMARTARERVVVRSAIREGLGSGRFRAWFQPVVALGNRAVVGHEALCRWITADGTVVGPDTFIPAADHANLIVDLDRTMLRQALQMASQQPRSQWVSVNMSAASLTEASLVEAVHEILHESGTDPARLQLEVTENSLMRDTDAARKNMHSLAEMGVCWWVDDFGTGYSSIAHLRDLPVAGLKLDRSFTKGITANATRARLAQGLIGLAAGLGLQTVAEGIETEPEAMLLNLQGWQMGQGWLFGRPQPMG